jgi:hypothetical protein
MRRWRVKAYTPRAERGRARRIKEVESECIHTIDAVDRCALVISSENKEIFRILDLVGQQ